MMKLWLAGTMRNGCVRVSAIQQKADNVWEYIRYTGEVLILAETETEATIKYMQWLQTKN